MATKRMHKATWAKDKRKGGYNVRVVGPKANMFAGREVPVTMMSGDEHNEKLKELIWSGKDKETGENVALYAVEPKPKQEQEDIEF